MTAAIAALLALSVLIELVCCLGVAVMPDAFDRLHYVGPAIIFPPVAIAAAVAMRDGFPTQSGIKAALIAVIFLITSPILSYATARVIAVRRFGDPRRVPVETLQEE